jgi:hypothetical protein
MDKPTGKAILAGFTLDFGVPLNAESAANFQVDTVTTKTVAFLIWLFSISAIIGLTVAFGASGGLSYFRPRVPASLHRHRGSREPFRATSGGGFSLILPKKM